MEPLISVTGLWLKKTKNGDQYFSGRLGNVNIMIFRNNRKTKENQPDYVLNISQSKKEAGGEQTVPRPDLARKIANQIQTKVEPKPMFNLEETIDDLPF